MSSSTESRSYENSIKSNASHSSLVGSNSALIVAFKDLKRRYLISKIDINQLKNENIKMKSEVEQCHNEIKLKDRKVIIMKTTLETKLQAYNNLEETYNHTRINELSLIKHLKENEDALDELTQKYHIISKENQRLCFEYEKSSKKIKSLLKEKNKIEIELADFKNIPEICIHPNLVNTSNVDEYNKVETKDLNYEDAIVSMKKQILHLLSEKQTLKTNVHWLTVELEKARGQKRVNKTPRKRNLSETLEEAGGGSLEKDERDSLNEADNLLGYSNKLHDIFNKLKDSLATNSVLLQEFKQPPATNDNGDISDQSNSPNPQSYSAFVANSSFATVVDKNITQDQNCDSGINNGQDEFQNIFYGQNKVADCKISVKSEAEHGISLTDIDQSQNLQIIEFFDNFDDQIESFDIDDLPKLSEPFWNDGVTTNHLKDPPDEMSDLPYSLFHQIHLLQTQTYLTSKTIPPQKLIEEKRVSDDILVDKNNR